MSEPDDEFVYANQEADKVDVEIYIKLKLMSIRQNNIYLCETYQDD